jgi:XRE family transcriptional regulator, regulator of sulfur utilization
MVNSSRVPRGQPDPPLGVAVRELREDRGLTQQRLAADAHVALHTVQQLEGGHSDPSWSTVRALAAALSTPVAKLVARAESHR